ncbi:MAG: DUF5597 domain-containing protein [Bacteroidales bacterium]|nr:DUF5597 domain-containing protein [Bacteroidales bacterium]
MKKIIRALITVLVTVAVFLSSCIEQESQPVPVLEKRGNATQLIVDGKPFLVLGGELHNSSSTSREYMKKFWPLLKASGMNTVLAAVEWSLIEPVEGSFSFGVVDEMITDARANDLKLVLLWFGSWKNGQSHYIPEWMKADFKRFPRVKGENGKSLEILTPLSQASLDADARAFAALMRHLKQVDEMQRTVIMIQVQNEVGIIGSPRDHGDAASSAFSSQVPRELMDHLARNKSNLLPETTDIWGTSGFKPAGTWSEVFGAGDKCDELFMGWHYADYINKVARAGKAEYSLPMFVNAWIVQASDKRPGDYPSGGPQAHMLDIWRAGAPDIDLYCPDIYRPEFREICALYTRSGNQLFIPEARAGETGAGQCFYAIGRHNSIGYSPFGFETRTEDPENDPMTKAYRLASSIAPLILEAQQKGTITSVLLNSEMPDSEDVILGDFRFEVGLLRGWGSGPAAPGGYCLIIDLSADEFLIYGSNVQVTFSTATPGPPVAGISRADEGSYVNGVWKPRRRLNGDDILIDYDLAKMALQNKTGTGLKFGRDNELFQRVRLYRYE